MNTVETNLQAIDVAARSIRDEHQKAELLLNQANETNVQLQKSIEQLGRDLAIAQGQLDVLRQLLSELQAGRPDEPAPVAPAAPTNLTIEQAANNGNKVTLEWKDNSENETVFAIEVRDTNAAPDAAGHGWRVVKTSGVDATSQDLVMDDRDWRYDFRVVALGAVVRDDEGKAVELRSEPSNIVANVFVKMATHVGDAAATKPAPIPDNFANAIIPKTVEAVPAAIAQAKREARPLIIENLVFDGVMIKLEGMERVLTRYNTIKNIPGGWFAGHGILIMQGLRNSRIYGNKFINIGDADIAGGYGNSDGLLIYENEHTNTKEGIHLVQGGPKTGVDINDETFVGLTRMAIELQHGGQYYRVRRCKGSNWRPGKDRDRFFISMAAVETLETLVEDCEGIASDSEPRGDHAQRMGICYEIAGRNAVLRNCKARGPWVAATALSGHSDPVKSKVLFENLDSCGWNEPWGAPHLPGGIYRDGTPAENITVKGGRFSKQCV